jgi:ElaB/YqjD/DUF883 family membrane-anchored ribosome-binding protein
MSTTETDRGNFEDVARRELRDDDDREPQAIERDIDATRADMRATLEALERRFSLERLVDMTVGRIRARGGEFAGNLTDAATQNPMPLLLTSIGLGWMMLAGRRGSRGNGGYYSADTVHGAMDSTRETMRSAMDSTRETWQQATESSRQTFEQTAESLRSGASRAAEITREQRDRVNRLIHEQPLMLGALGLAAGAIIGALLPTTEHEARMLGEMRDKTFKEVAQKSRAKLDAAKEHVAAALRPEASADDGASSASKKAATRPH